MRIATWNVRHGRPFRGFTSNRRLASSAHDLDVDVLAVQEVERHVIRSWFANQPAVIADALDADAFAYVPRGTWRSRAATASRCVSVA